MQFGGQQHWREGYFSHNLTLPARFVFTWKWDRRTDYKPAAPCLAIEIVAGAASPVTLRDALTIAVCCAPAMRSWF